MSQQHDWTCDKKRTFKSGEAAHAELKRLRRKVVDWSRLKAYHCTRHNGWHLGNQPIRKYVMLSDLERRDPIAIPKLNPQCQHEFEFSLMAKSTHCRKCHGWKEPEQMGEKGTPAP